MCFFLLSSIGILLMILLDFAKSTVQVCKYHMIVNIYYTYKLNNHHYSSPLLQFWVLLGYFYVKHSKFIACISFLELCSNFYTLPSWCLPTPSNWLAEITTVNLNLSLSETLFRLLQELLTLNLVSQLSLIWRKRLHKHE